MLKIQRILVPVDLSARSGVAVKHGVNIAKHFNASVVVLHAIPDHPYNPVLASGYPGGLAPDPPDQKQQVDDLLAKFLREAVPGYEGEHLVLRSDPVAAIEGLVRDRQIDLIVMPTSGHGLFRSFVLGSVTTKVLNDLICPVLTGAHVEEIDAKDPQPYKRIGCAVELADRSADILAKAKDFASAYGAEVTTVIHAISAFSDMPPPSANGGGWQDRARAETQRLIDAADISAEPVAEFGSPEELVAKTIEDRNIDLLVMGRHGGDGALNGLLTHAYGVIRQAPCPVLSV